jgi:antitoxin HicB
MKLEDYLKLKYPITLYPEAEGFSVEIKHLPGCVSQGDTLEEALEMLEDAKYAWIKTNLELGNQIPLPSSEISDRSKIEKSREIPESWEKKETYRFQVTWMTNFVSRAQQKTFSDLRKITFQHYKNLRDQGKLSNEQFRDYTSNKKQKIWSYYAIAKEIRETHFEKFYFDVIESIFSDKYLSINYLDILSNPTIKFNPSSLSYNLRENILLDLESVFSNDFSGKTFEKQYEIGKFALKIRLTKSMEDDFVISRFEESSNPAFNEIGKYCYVSRYNAYDFKVNLNNEIDISEGRLSIMGNKIICGSWEYLFENNDIIYGNLFDSFWFYPSDNKVMFKISISEDEAWGYYENGLRHE